MNETFSNLWTALAERKRLEAGGPFPNRKLPSPWVIWALIGLARHHDRQKWVADVVKYRLSGEPRDLSAAGAFAHPDIPQQGIVPGLVEWEYYFHGGGCCLTHRASGEAIDVDFYDETGEYIDDYFYVNYLKSLRAPEPPEQRLLELHPSAETCRLSMDVLLEEGLLVRYPDRKVFRLADAVHQQRNLIDEFTTSWADPMQRPMCAVAIGDWLASECRPGGNWTAEQIREVERRALQCRADRLTWLKLRFRSEASRPLALLAVGEVDKLEQEDLLRQALKDKPSGTVSTALATILEHNDPRWCNEVYALFRRVSPNRDIPEPHIWKTCAQFLLQHDFQSRQVLRSLAGAQRHELADAALLALEFAPEYSLDLFRRALRSDIPYNRLSGAAILAIIDRPWSRRELASVLRESDEQTPTAECRAALLASHDTQAHEVVRAWEELNPHEPELGPYFTFEELSLRSSYEEMQYEMQKYHDRVLPLRDRQIT